MRALTVLPGVANSLRLDEVPEPPLSEGSILARAIALGVCGTDREIVAGEYGAAPAGQERLILGHELLGRVEQAPSDSGFAPGDLIVGFVRHPDPVPCPACAAGEWDMCLNGEYTEHGIKARNGFGAELFRIEPEFAIKVDPGLDMLGVLDRADQRGRQGMGSHRWCRPAVTFMASENGSCHRCGSHWAARGADWGATRAGGSSSGPQCYRAQARARARPRC